ncbi:hypothetical protein [Burkholderia sp. LMG 13014]|nr:hypothetical protein [Burkholderia sp. LMG 13014]
MEAFLFLIGAIAVAIIWVLGSKVLKEMMFEALGFVFRATGHFINWMLGR